MQRSHASTLIFLLVFVLIFGGLHLYLWHRLVRAPAFSDEWQRRGTVILIVLALLTPLTFFASSALPRSVARWVSAVGYGWLGVAMLLFFLLLGSELVRGLVIAASSTLSEPLSSDRRTFLSRVLAGSAAALGVILAGSGTASALGSIAISRVRVPLSRLPKKLAGFRIVQLSDIHIGPTISGSWLREVVAQVNALEPDLVAITGDLVDGSVARLGAEVAPLADLRARFGVYFVTGNHEYYSGVNEWIAELERLGVRVLRNERVSIGEGEESFDLAGVDDLSARRYRKDHGADLSRALAGRDPNRELVLLAHQPKQIYEAAKASVGLQLSGHTHGGQIFPWHFFVGLDQPYLAGLYRHEGTQLYVSRGTGYWGPPMRVAAPAEIAVVELEVA